MREKLIGTELIKEAMKSGDKMRLQVVKNLKSDIIRKEGGRKEMTDSEIISLIKKSIVNLNQNISVIENSTKDIEAIKEAKDEIAILETFVPDQMTKVEIEDAIIEIITDTGASSIKDMGKVMGMFSKKYTGKADNGIASSIIKNKLG